MHIYKVISPLKKSNECITCKENSKIWFRDSKLFSSNKLRPAMAIITTMENWQ